MLNNLSDRGVDNANRNEEDSGSGRSGWVGSAFEDFLSGSATATFYITIDTNFVGHPSAQNHLLPIFIIRDVSQNSISINLDSTVENTSFVSFVKELISNIRKKERIKKELLKNQPYVFTRDMKAQECTICLNDFKAKQHIRKLDCEHEFHKRCIDRWLLKGNACCPMCRKEPFKSKAE